MIVVKFFSKIKNIHDMRFNNVRATTAYSLILVGLVNFMALGVAYTKLAYIQHYNWGIYAGLGLADTLLLPILQWLMIGNGIIGSFGLYLLKHLEPDDDRHLIT